MAWHEASVWSQELFTYANIDISFDIKLSENYAFQPRFNLVFADIAFFEESLVFFQYRDWPDNWCNYMGYYAEIFDMYMDVGAQVKEC